VHKKRILIIDDNAAMRSVLRRSIENDQFIVCGEAEDGMKGIEKAKETCPDLILLDFSMPKMNGADAAPILKKLLPNVPIILFTMHEEMVSKALAAAMCVDRVLPKPSSLTDLLDCMRTLLRFSPLAICAASSILSWFRN
jgi:two-component system, chemotaxis family, chemotaxis protein CheY